MSAPAITLTNHLTLHGSTPGELILPGEDPAGLQSLVNSLVEDYRPETTHHRLLIESVATAQWFLWRRQRAHRVIESALYRTEPDPSQWTVDHLKKLSQADRYTAQAERSLSRALANLDREHKLKRAEIDREFRRTQSEAAQSIRERRITLQEQKLQLAKARTEAKQAVAAIRFAKNAVSSPSPRQPEILPAGQADSRNAA